MSIISNKKRQRPATATPENETAPRPARRKKRRLTISAFVLLGLVLLVGLLPTIIAHTPLMAYWVRRTARLEGTIRFRSASIGWFSAASVSGIEIRDAQDEPVLEADRLTCDRSLLKFLFNSSKIGTLRIEKPRLSVKLTRDGSNVEAVLAHWLNGQGSPSQGVDLSVEIVDGEATIAAQEAQQGWHATGLQLEAQWAAGQIRCKAESDVDQFVVATASGQPESRVHCAVQCSYQIADNVLKIDECELSSGIAAARAGGQIGLGNPGDVQLTGEVSCEWDKLNPLLQPYCGTAIQFSGSGTSPIAYRGPFSPARGEASAALPFSGANVYGFQFGPGELKVHLADGVLRADPLEVACNQGRVVLQPEFRMDRQPAEFHLSAGTLARHIQLDQAACRSALKYVVPVLASVTQSQGQFSIELDGCRIPIGDWNHAEIAGRMIVHSAQISPGPLVQELTSSLATSPTLVRIQPESVILFRMTGGRIYHQGLTLEFPELTMRTYGSVGLDDSLKLMVEMSVPLSWLPRNAVTDAIKKQKVQIPVGGTLKSPQLDRAELARLKQAVGNLTRSVLPGDLGNQLNRFLQRKPGDKPQP